MIISQLNRESPLLLPIHETDDHYTVKQGDPFTSAYSPTDDHSTVEQGDPFIFAYSSNR